MWYASYTWRVENDHAGLENRCHRNGHGNLFEPQMEGFPCCFLLGEGRVFRWVVLYPPPLPALKAPWPGKKVSGDTCLGWLGSGPRTSNRHQTVHGPRWVWAGTEGTTPGLLKKCLAASTIGPSFLADDVLFSRWLKVSRGEHSNPEQRNKVGRAPPPPAVPFPRGVGCCSGRALLSLAAMPDRWLVVIAVLLAGLFPAPVGVPPAAPCHLPRPLGWSSAILQKVVPARPRRRSCWPAIPRRQCGLSTWTLGRWEMGNSLATRTGRRLMELAGWNPTPGGWSRQPAAFF